VLMVKRFFKIIAVVIYYGVAVGSLTAASDTVNQPAPDPLNTTYRIEGDSVALVDGRHERPAASGSAIKVRTTVWQQPVYGDLDGDGNEDAALVLIHAPGGSGTFYYVAAAINADGQSQGTNTVLLGDRIVPKKLAIRDRTVVIDYADRRPDEPFSTTPSVDRSKVMGFQDGQLLTIPSPDESDQVTRGVVTIGHEVRSFQPCGSQMDLWLMGQSPALRAIMAAYNQAMPDPENYRPVFMVLAGKPVDPPTRGFGADYDGAFQATRLLRVAPEASCGIVSMVADSAESVRHKIDFDISALDNEGLLGPQGGKRSLSYEFCIPDRVENRVEVERIDPTVSFSPESPGRIGCASQEILCIGSAHQRDFNTVLQQLAELPYVQRIQQTFFE